MQASEASPFVQELETFKADRLAAIGGELTVTSEPGSGTTLQATLPAGT